MKQLLFVFIICVAAAGCKKCHQCTTYVTTTISGMSSQSGSDRNELCDKSNAEIEQYERDNTGTVTSSAGGFTTTASSVTNCD